MNLEAKHLNKYMRSFPKGILNEATIYDLDVIEEKIASLLDAIDANADKTVLRTKALKIYRGVAIIKTRIS